MNLRLYKYSRIQKAIMEKLIKEMLETSIIQNNTSPFTSPVMLVKKTYHSWRLCGL